MIPKFLTDTWTSIAPALGNHLWQSTLFACAAALLTLAFRNNHARTRYALWLAASLKFLVPFSLLANLGSFLAASHARVRTRTVLYSALEQFNQPFAGQNVAAVPQRATGAAIPSPSHLPPALLVVWLCGFAVVAFVWMVRWRRVRVSIQGAVPLREGREPKALRRLERLHGMPRPTEIFLSRTSLEPGIFGIARPILLWPQGISDRLNDAHLDAVLAHELRHVRRRDNLAAALHMLVEAVFWFHPLIWWLGTRLIAERERACDEEVLEFGSDPQAYAEGILKVCEFCVRSPLTCISSVTGADLKKRIQRIMSPQVARKLDISRKLLLAAAVVLAVAAPIVAGAFHVAPSHAASPAQNATTAMRSTQNVAPTVPAFHLVSIKANKSGDEFSHANFSITPGDTSVPADGRFSGTNVPLISYIYFAYKLTGSQFQLLLPTLPSWLISDRFDIEAQAAGNPSNEQMRLVMQAVLADRFHLAAHYESRQLPVYALVLAKPGETGPQLRPHSDDPPCSTPAQVGDGRSEFPPTIAGGLPADCGRIEALPSSRMGVGARKIPIGLLAATLTQMHNFDHPVVDQTGLAGNYDVTFEWTARRVDRANPHGEKPAPEFVRDLHDQLGLRLEPQTGPAEVFIIDHVEHPSEN